MTWRQAAQAYSALPDHRALAISRRQRHWIGAQPSRGDAARLAAERCGYNGQLPCLIISIDGFWTVELPISHTPIDVFLPMSEAELPADQRRSIAMIYQGKPWRALARGHNNTWHAVAGASSEAAAVDAALQACAAPDTDCRLFAIGNFRVAGNGR